MQPNLRSGCSYGIAAGQLPYRGLKFTSFVTTKTEISAIDSGHLDIYDSCSRVYAGSSAT